MTKMDLRKKLGKELSRAKKEITTIIATVLLYYGLLLGLYGFAIFYHFVGEWFNRTSTVSDTLFLILSRVCTVIEAHLI